MVHIWNGSLLSGLFHHFSDVRMKSLHEWREVPGGHFFRHDLFVQDLNGMLGRLRRAG
ncbi:hypothetical protein ACQRWP_14710 [Micromonospora trifolii]|uniref:hypothetical protein n=1 Tax=Micromonospora trifolii TaxID=2911208 RepID=UPI003D2EFB27